MKIKKGDKVIVIAGASKGKEGTVQKALPKLNKIVIEGVNVRKKHRRPTKAGQKGSLVEMAMPMNVSNVKLVSSSSSKEKTSAKKTKAK